MPGLQDMWIGKVFLWLGIAYMSILLAGWGFQVLAATISFADTGNPKPLVDATVGQFLTFDTQLNTAIDSIVNKDALQAKYPQVYTDAYLAYHKSYVMSRLLVFVALFIIMYKALKFFAGQRQFDPIIIFLIIIGIVLLWGIAEVLYSYFVTGIKIIPLSGVARSIYHFPKIVSSSGMMNLLGSMTPLGNATELVNTTLNATVNGTVV